MLHLSLKQVHVGVVHPALDVGNDSGGVKNIVCSSHGFHAVVLKLVRNVSQPLSSTPHEISRAKHDFVYLSPPEK